MMMMMPRLFITPQGQQRRGQAEYKYCTAGMGLWGLGEGGRGMYRENKTEWQSSGFVFKTKDGAWEGACGRARIIELETDEVSDSFLDLFSALSPPL